MVQITVHDSLDALRDLFTDALQPHEKFRRARPLLFDPGAAIRPVYQARARHGRSWPALEVMTVAGCDGLEAASATQGWGLFNPARSLEAAAWEFEQYAALDVRGLAQAILARLAQILALPDAQVDCLLLPCDSANRSLMAFSHGLSVYGAAPGLILLRLWPCAANLQRLPAALARAWAQTLRHLVFGRETLRRLADFLVMEGLAAALVARLQPKLSAPWLATLAKPVGWDDELARIARCWYGPEDYSDLVTNVYGAQLVMGLLRAPPARALDAETLALTLAIMGENLDSSQAVHIAAQVYGDELLAHNGHPPAGLPAWAGFEVGQRLVQDWLYRTGGSLGDLLVTPTAQIIAEARCFDQPW